MSRGIKIGLTVGGIVAVLPIVAIVVLLLGTWQLKPLQTVRREIPLPNHGSLIIDGARRSRSEHGFSQRAGYRAPGSVEIEWFGDVSDGVEPQVYQAGPLVVVIDLPAAQLYVRTNVVRAESEQASGDGGGRVNLHRLVSPRAKEKWKNLALIFPDDLGRFPISF